MIHYNKKTTTSSRLTQFLLSSVSHMYGFSTITELDLLASSSLSFMHVQVSDIFLSLLKRTMLPLIRSFHLFSILFYTTPLSFMQKWGWWKRREKPTNFVFFYASFGNFSPCNFQLFPTCLYMMFWEWVIWVENRWSWSNFKVLSFDRGWKFVCWVTYIYSHNFHNLIGKNHEMTSECVIWTTFFMQLKRWKFI